MPRFILLTGAGFSRNWGGWLASEALAFLLGCSLDEESRNLLWQHGQFESALAKLQDNATRNGATEDRARLKRFEDAIVRMFDDMNMGFSKTSFEFESGTSTVQKFIAKFDAIFTLNQDNLLEGHYFQNAYVHGWAGAQVPGLRRLQSTGAIQDPFKDRWEVMDEKEWRVHEKHQPYFKLHGSSSWVDRNGSRLLVLGENKEATIREHQLLTWYREEFKKALRTNDTRLMIIGYGFNDDHINQEIYEALRGTQLKLFLFDPAGIELLRTKKPSPDLFAEARRVLIGASQRQFSSAFGRDHIELKKVMRFFE